MTVDIVLALIKKYVHGFCKFKKEKLTEINNRQTVCYSVLLAAHIHFLITIGLLNHRFSTGERKEGHFEILS